METSILKEFIDSIAYELQKTSNPRAINLATMLKVIPLKYEKYYPVKELKDGVERIKQDKNFIKPKSIINIDPIQDAEEFLNGLDKLQWEDKILKRFNLFAVVKVICELVKKNAPSNHSDSNKVKEYIEFISSLMLIIEPGLQQFRSATFNSSDKNNTGRVTIPHAEFLLSKFDEEIKIYKRLVATIPGSDEQKKQIALFLTTFNIEEYQTYIFDGILEDFDISKKGTTGEQSIRYKSELLWNLFIHTHKANHHESDIQGADVRSIRTKNLLKIITPHNNQEIIDFLS